MKIKPLRAALLLPGILIVLASCEKTFFVDEPENQPTALFGQLWNDFHEMYAPFEYRNIDWHSTYQQYAGGVYDGMSDDSLFSLLCAMLAPLNDGHVNLTAPNRKSFNSNRVYRDSIGFNLFDLDVIQSQYLHNQFEGDEAFGFVYGLIRNEIIYLFLPYVADNMPVMDEVLDAYPSAKGMIIDLRHSFGGDFTWGLQYLQRFTTERRLVFTSSTRNGPGAEDFDPWYSWYLEPGGEYFDKKVVFLTDRYTISASERTAMALKVLPQAIHMGDTTNGAHSTMIGRELQNGWCYSLSPQKIIFADGKTYEGLGLIPDTVVHNSRLELDQGIDRMLDEAISRFQ